MPTTKRIEPRWDAPPSDETVFEGGCLCRAVRYRTTAAPVRGVICHCSMCRKHSGAPALSFVHFPIDRFNWTRGEPTRYRSSKFAERGFCAKCGSTLTMHEEVLGDRMLVAVGSLDHPERVKIDDQVWTSSRIPWFRIAGIEPQFETNSTAVATRAHNR